MMERKTPTPQIAHLIYAITQATPKKPKELFFCQRPNNKIYWSSKDYYRIRWNLPKKIFNRLT